MKRLVLIVIGLVLFFSALFVVGEQMGWMEEAFVNEKINAVQSSTGGQVAVSGAVVGLLVVDILLPIPSSVVMVLSGKLLGAFLGGLISFIGAMLAAAIGYYACRLGGQRAFERIVGKAETETIRAWFERYGVYAIIISRPIPMLTEILSCLAGMSRFSARTFFSAAVLGTLPICFVYSIAGSLGSQTGIGIALAVSLGVPAVGWLITQRIKGSTPEPTPKPANGASANE